MKNFLPVLFPLILAMMSCEKELLGLEVDCNRFSTGLLHYDTSQVRQELHKLTVDLTPAVTKSDPIGHRINLDLLVERINSQCPSMEAKLSCYACIFTFPAQSHLSISIDSSGTLLHKIIDISTDKSANLSFVGLHR